MVVTPKERMALERLRKAHIDTCYDTGNFPDDLLYDLVAIAAIALREHPDNETLRGVFFEKQDNGAVRIIKRVMSKGNAEVVDDVTIDSNSWCSIIASVSYYGEEDYGWYRARNFHQGVPLDQTTPLKDKTPVLVVSGVLSMPRRTSPQGILAATALLKKLVKVPKAEVEALEAKKAKRKKK